MPFSGGLCSQRVQDLVVVMICRCRTVSVKAVISSNAVGKQTMGAQDSSGFPIVIQSDCDADVDTAVGGGGGGGGVGRESQRRGGWSRKTERKEQKIKGGRGKR